MRNEVAARAESVFFSTYKRMPVVFVRGEGCRLWDSEGREYIDFLAGIAVCNLGHAEPRVAKALAAQANLLFHVSNLYYTVPQVELASWLTGRSFADRVFFCNSGAEANEAAIKLARRYFSEKGEKDRFRIVAARQSFHGRTMAALSATGQDKIKGGFAPLLEGFDFAPFNDIDALKSEVGPSTAAVILEPIQGEGGVVCPDDGYLKAVRNMCDEAGCLLIFDEIQTGIGRTGKLFAYEHFDVAPDIMTLAKALGNGLPIGAMLATEDVSKGFGPGSHASTFGGTPVITAAALETLRILEEDNIIVRCRENGEYFKERLTRLRQKHACVLDIRGMGMLLGVKLAFKGEPVVNGCLEKGFVINCIQDDILRFAPPLVIGKKEIDLLVECLDELLNDMA